MYNALQSALASLEVTNSTALINGIYYSVLIKVHTWEEKVKSVVLMIFRPSANNTVFSGYDSDIVHDIRTPVTAILNATEILKQDGSDPQVLQKFLPLIDEQSKRLYHIAKNIKARQECH
jgi:signal transduction histidine kinase